MTDYEFSGSSDNEQSDAEAEYDDDVSDFENDESPLPDLQSACHRERYESTAGTWTADPPPRVETFTPYNPLPEEPKNPDSESDLFGCFISVGIIKIIVKHTNEEFDVLRKKFEREGSGEPPPLDPTYENEMKAKCGRHVCLNDANQVVYCKDCKSTSPARKVSAPPATQHLTRSQAKSVEPSVIGRCALCPTNQKDNTRHQCEAYGKTVCPTLASKRNVIQSSKDAAYLARHVGLRVGLPQHVPAVTINRLCGSGFEAIIMGAQQILAGDSHVILAGGTESMTQAPFSVRGARFGIPLGTNVAFEDSLWQGLTDWQINTPMGMTAENLGEKYKVTRQEADEFALKSQNRWRLANNAGYFKAEIEPVKLTSKKGEEVFEVDEHPRETTIESLAKLKPVFKKDGLVNAGNASGICDGAAALVVADEQSLQKHHLEPLARIVGWHQVGCDPSIMGVGPVDAIRHLVKKTGVSLDSVDLVEVNEAFAAQVVSVQKELKIESDRLNVNGGAIALGHPLGASGARISTHLVHELRRRNARYGIGSACIGGGQGIAMLFERV